MADAILWLCFLGGLTSLFFFIFFCPPTPIFPGLLRVDGMLRILRTARVRLFDTAHRRFVLRAAYRQRHGRRWQPDRTFRLGRNHLHHSAHALETGALFFSFFSGKHQSSFLTVKSKNEGVLFVLSWAFGRDRMSVRYWRPVATKFKSHIFFE
jgi:hypothetical protein